MPPFFIGFSFPHPPVPGKAFRCRGVVSQLDRESKLWWADLGLRPDFDHRPTRRHEYPPWRWDPVNSISILSERAIVLVVGGRTLGQKYSRKA